MRRMMECVDGEYQTFKSKDGAYVREYFFNTPELKALVADWSDEDIWNLNRGGHDPHKVYAAYHAAVNHKGQPTVILAKTIKGYGMGEAGEAQNITHQQKKMYVEAIRRFRDRFQHSGARRQARGSAVRQVRRRLAGARIHARAAHGARRLSAGAPAQGRVARRARRCRRSSASSRAPTTARSRRRWRSCRSCRCCCATRTSASTSCRSSPTNRARSAWKACSASSASGTSSASSTRREDDDQLMFYKEDKHGQILQEGINEAGAMCDWIAAATSYSTHGVPMIPFYIFYSMFGFQRVGDLAWAAGDMRSRGFLLGGTAGRTTLNGEGLQHEDGHSHVSAATIPNCISYDPTFALRGRGDHPGRPAPHVRRAAGRLLLPDGDERELPRIRRCRKARRRDIIKGMYLFTRRRGEEVEGAARAAAGLGHDLPRSDRRGGAAARRLGRRRRPVELPVVHRACARRHGGRRAATCCIRRRSRARRTSTHCLAETRAR